MKIQSKITTIVIIGSIVISLILHATYIFNNLYRLNEELNNKISFQSRLLGSVISRPLYNYDIETINKILESFMQDIDISTIHIKDFASEKIIERIRDENPDIEYIENEEIIFNNNESIGVISLKFSTASIGNELGNYIKQAIISLLIISYIQFILLLLSVRNIVSPIKYLTHITKEISNGKLNKKINIDSNDEIGELAVSFSRMQESINARTKELEDHRANLESIVEKRTEELRNAQKLLVEAEKMASLSGLVAGISHEINTPIGIGITAATHFVDETLAIKGKYDTGAISKQKLDKYLKVSVGISELILSNLKKVSETVQSFKEIVIDHSNNIVSKFKIIHYIKNVMNKVKSIYINSDIHINYNDEAEDFYVECDPGIMSKIITILFMNSIQHGFNNLSGQIDIDITRNGSDLQIFFKDNGSGIDKEYIANVFDPFFTTNRGQNNIGLGLSILYNLVTISLDGEVRCESNKGSGTTFNILIPEIIVENVL